MKKTSKIKQHHVSTKISTKLIKNKILPKQSNPMQQSKPIPSQQLPQCSVCKLDPVPQSSQHILLLIIEVGLIFVDWKLSLILLMLGYSFPQTNWKCPYCSRDIPVRKEHNTSESIFLRLGKCMALFSLNKFRIFAGAIIIWMAYLLISQRLYNPKKYVTKTWISMVEACGFEVYMENSVRSNHFYRNYLDSGYDWEFQAIYLSRQPTGIEDFENIFFKMDPTQFKDPEAYDFKAFTRIGVGKVFNKGEVIRMKGQWEGRQYHNFIFNPVQMNRTGRTKDPASCMYIYDKNSLLRSHLDAVKQQYEAQQNPQTNQKDKQILVEVKEGHQNQQAGQKSNNLADIRQEQSNNVKGKHEN